MVSKKLADIEPSIAEVSNGVPGVLTTVNIKKGETEENLVKFDSIQVSDAIQTAAELRGVLGSETMGINDKFLNQDGFPMNTGYEDQIQWTELMHESAIRIISRNLITVDQSDETDSVFNETCVDPDEVLHSNPSKPSDADIHAGQDKKDIDIANVALHSVESISHVTFEQNAIVLACLAVRYIHKGKEGFKSSESYLARYNNDERNLVLDGIPDGSLLKFVADISAMTNVELEGDRWYLYDRSSQRKVHLSLTGTAFKVWFSLTKVGHA